MTKTILLTLVTAVVLLECCFGRQFTVKCYSKTANRDGYDPVMMKENARESSVAEQRVFNVIPNTKIPPSLINVSDSRTGVTRGCQIELLVQNANGFNLAISKNSSKNDGTLVDSKVDVGISLDNNTWTDDLPLLAKAVFLPDDDFQKEQCKSDYLFTLENNWTNFFTNTFNYIPWRDQNNGSNNNSVVVNPNLDPYDQSMIGNMQNVEYSKVKDGVHFIPMDQSNLASPSASPKAEVGMNGDIYCILIPYINQQRNFSDSEKRTDRKGLKKLSSTQKGGIYKEHSINKDKLLLLV